MKPSIHGNIKLSFSKKTNETDVRLALLQGAYAIREILRESLYVKFVNSKGEELIVDIYNADIDLDSSRFYSENN